jgi:cell division protein FtsB
VADLEINAQRVYERLGNKIAKLEAENAQLQEGVEVMAQRISDLENPKDVPDKQPGK